jgi:hypothetical protein
MRTYDNNGTSDPIPVATLSAHTCYVSTQPQHTCVRRVYATPTHAIATCVRRRYVCTTTQQKRFQTP